MKITSAIFEQAGKELKLQTFDKPQLDPGDLLVRVEACAICGSDLHTFNGLRQEKTPTILGHEAIGIIDDIESRLDPKDNNKHLKVGDRVTWSVCAHCGECDRCQSNVPQKCRQLKKFGHEQVKGDGPIFGGFSDCVVLPETTPIFKIPSEIPAEVICPANCATATVMACMEKAGKVQGKRVLVIGAGLLGLTAVAYCSAAGANQVSIMDPDPSRSDLAREFGAEIFQTAGDDEPATLEKFDLIFDFAGSTQAIQESLPLLDINGIFVIAGTVMPSDDLRVDPEKLLRNLNSIVGVHNYRPDHLEKAIQFLVEHGARFPFRDLVAKSFTLEKINDAFDYALAHRPVRVMVKP